MRLGFITSRLGRLSLPRLEDIGAAMMAAPNPCGRTFESFMPDFLAPPFEEKEALLQQRP